MFESYSPRVDVYRSGLNLEVSASGTSPAAGSRRLSSFEGKGASQEGSEIRGSSSVERVNWWTRVWRLVLLQTRHGAKSNAPGDNATLPPGTNSVIWHPPGSAPNIAGYTVGGGMLYLGTASSNPIDVCVIDTEAEVGGGLPEEAQEPRWISYADMSPHSRLDYVRWLAAGKCDPLADAGYLRLYLLGLERRLIVERATGLERDLILGEVLRFQTCYGGYPSLAEAARRLADAAEALRLLDGEAVVGGYEPELDVPLGSMPPLLGLTLAMQVEAGCPLNFSLAIAGFIGLPGHVVPRNAFVIDRARKEFLEAFRKRFNQRFPEGWRLRKVKGPRIKLNYEVALTGVTVNLVSGVEAGGLPNVEALDWSEMTELAACVHRFD